MTEDEARRNRALELAVQFFEGRSGSIDNGDHRDRAKLLTEAAEELAKYIRDGLVNT